MIVTNNPRVFERLSHVERVEFFDVSYEQILLIVRDKIHLGYGLRTHPLSGSVKPNETPYKSIMLSDAPCNAHAQFAHDSQNLESSVHVIESCIQTYQKFEKRTTPYSQKLSDDFMLIDFELICSAL